MGGAAPSNPPHRPSCAIVSNISPLSHTDPMVSLQNHQPLADPRAPGGPTRSRTTPSSGAASTTTRAACSSPRRRSAARWRFRAVRSSSGESRRGAGYWREARKSAGRGRARIVAADLEIWRSGDLPRRRMKGGWEASRHRTRRAHPETQHPVHKTCMRHTQHTRTDTASTRRRRLLTCEGGGAGGGGGHLTSRLPGPGRLCERRPQRGAELGVRLVQRGCDLDGSGRVVGAGGGRLRQGSDGLAHVLVGFWGGRWGVSMRMGVTERAMCCGLLVQGRLGVCG
jgi:hypothetical protein